VQKRLLLQAAACNLALLLRKLIGAGTPRALQDAVIDLFSHHMRRISTLNVIAVASVPVSPVEPDTASRTMRSIKTFRIVDSDTGC